MNIEELLTKNHSNDLLRFLTCGSVDDGKSTMIGRLLHDSKQIYDDHLTTLEKDSKRVGSAGTAIDFSLLLDGLKAEREQGITIDVAYRYFSTPKRKFIIADCPGHEQYTRNMATGASTANLAVVLIDARHGVVQQTRRHSFIASLLDVSHIVVAINKMDLVGYSEEVFEKIRKDYETFSSRLQVRNIQFIPMSALLGDNVVQRSDKTPWYNGLSLLDYLQTVHIASERNLVDLRFPVQYVLRQDMNFRGYCGTVASGILRPGAEIKVLPSGKKTKVKAIHNFGGTVEQAFPPMAVTVQTEDELDISRGDTLVSPNNLPQVRTSFDAAVVWMANEPLDTKRLYHIKHGTSESKAEVSEVAYRFNVNTISREDATTLELNEIGRLRIETSRPLVFDSYRRNRATGNFILIDAVTNGTVAAGMILERGNSGDAESVDDTSFSRTYLREKFSRISQEERQDKLGHKPATIWLTGLPKSGKSTIAYTLEQTLFDRGVMAHVLDDENLRLGLSKNLGFTPSDNSENTRRIANIAKICNDMGLITIVATVSANTQDREEAKALIGIGQFLEIHIDAPLETCESRDDNGRYAAARDGKISHFVGISTSYEVPLAPACTVNSANTTIEQAVHSIVCLLEQRNLIF